MQWWLLTASNHCPIKGETMPTEATLGSTDYRCLFIFNVLCFSLLLWGVRGRQNVLITLEGTENALLFYTIFLVVFSAFLWVSLQCCAFCSFIWLVSRDVKPLQSGDENWEKQRSQSIRLNVFRVSNNNGENLALKLRLVWPDLVNKRVRHYALSPLSTPGYHNLI